MTKRGKSDKLDADETHIYFIDNICLHLCSSVSSASPNTYF